jgi:hypothetical protein
VEHRATDKSRTPEQIFERFRAIHKGELAGIAPTGKPVTVSGISIHALTGFLLLEAGSKVGTSEGAAEFSGSRCSLRLTVALRKTQQPLEAHNAACKLSSGGGSSFCSALRQWGFACGWNSHTTLSVSLSQLYTFVFRQAHQRFLMISFHYCPVVEVIEFGNVLIASD